MTDLALDRTDIATLHNSLADGSVSSAELTGDYLSRIKKYDSALSAVLHLNPEAEDIARQRDKERANGKPLGPLHGIPVMVKDNLDTRDSQPTTAGSLALAEHFAAKDSEVVQKLRGAGAVLLGKTNLSEWANFRSTRSASGWSSLGGQTRNPYALDRTPGGSSSGSAVAVAAGFCAAAIGTETDGSIVGPAAMNGVVGIKPTVGLVSRSGIIPISSSQDTAGPIARSVADAAFLLAAIADTDTTGPVTVQDKKPVAVDYPAYLKADGLANTRIGACRLFAEDQASIGGVFEDSLTALREAGAQVIEELALPSLVSVREHELVVMATEFRQGLNDYLATAQAASVRSLSDLITFNRNNTERVMPYFAQELLERSASAPSISDSIYLTARRESLRLTASEGIDRALSEHRLDAIVVPTTSTPWVIDWVNGDNRSGSSAYLAAVPGYPSITVPAGYVHGLPVGISFIAGPWQEPLLIRLAHAFESVTKVRQPPGFKGSIEN